MSIQFKRGSRKVSQKQFFDGLKDDIVKAAQDEVEKKLKAVRDPETGDRIRVSKKPGSGELQWQLEGSPAAIEQAKKILGGHS